VSKRRRPQSPAQASAVRGPLDRLLDPELFKALGDPTRARLVACLAKCGRPCSVTEVAACCAVDFSVVSRHLSTLARAGIVEATKAGRVVRYEVRYARVCAALRGLADAFDDCCPGGDKGAGGRCGCG
jgi:ArsR family transcriptional regulator